MRIKYIDHKGAITFTVNEIEKYLKLISETEIDVSAESIFVPSEDDVLWLGLCDDFKIHLNHEKGDDGIYIDFNKGKGIIAGLNERSVLLAVYRFLSEIGCRWTRPGKDGEYIPKRSIQDMVVNLKEIPSYRHRGVCIEGAVSLENVVEMIDYLPKIGCNSYFVQFREAYTFFDRWYNHKNNPLYTPEGFSIEKSRQLTEQVKGEALKRGLAYHAVGHGWTCECIDVPGLSWEAAKYDVKPEFVNLIAEVNGERAIWGDIPLNTNLCYSNPETRQRVVKCIADYLLENRGVDVLHFWLADMYNNQCECENCAKKIPTDFYIDMLNELDELLTSLNIDTKIVFLLYCELLWPPETEKINNPDRFILMFAPITRTYSKPLTPGENVELPEYQRNKVKFSESIDENLSFLRKWQEFFKGDSFNFDYHFMWEHFYDAGQFKIAKVLSEDIKNLGKLGLNGFISCQVQRSFFPAGLGVYVMGRTLWNKEYTFEELSEEYFKASFGEDWEECMHYLSKLSELFDTNSVRTRETLFVDLETAKRLKEVPECIEKFRSIIKKNMQHGSESQRKSWEYLEVHSEFCILYSKVLATRIEGNKEEAKVYWKELKSFLWKNEATIQNVFDVFEFIETFQLIYSNVWQFE